MFQGYLVLSGGLGSSMYLKERIENRYLREPGSKNYKNIPHMKILRADEP